MLTTRGLAGLRRAATLNHLCPALCTRLGIDGRTVVEVRWSPRPAPMETTSLHPCAFRTLVALAWESYREGGRPQLLDLPCDPSVQVEPVHGGATWLSGIVRVPQTDHHSYLLTTTLDPDVCHRSVEPYVDRIGALVAVEGIGVRGDPDTHVSVVQVDVAPEGEPPDEPVLIDLLEQVAASLATAELIADLTLSERA